VNYSTDGEKVRAFALEVTVDNGFRIASVFDYKRGESNAASPGYGIFPGSFRTSLNPAEINWIEPNYSPVASTNDPDGAGTGVGTNKVILEMGTLYPTDAPEANKPGTSGTLCRLVIDPNRACTPADCNLTFAVNTLRGGVVLTDGSTVVPTVVKTAKFSFPDKFPCWSPYTLQYNQWLDVFRPDCWAGICAADGNFWDDQCYGDADAKYQGGSRYRVYTSDYNKLVANWKKKATSLKVADDACADVDHKYQGGSKYRVYTSDYNILVANWKKKATQLQGAPCPQP